LLDPRDIGPIRLVGVGFSGLSDVRQGSLFPDLDLVAIRDFGSGSNGVEQRPDAGRQGLADSRPRNAISLEQHHFVSEHSHAPGEDRTRGSAAYDADVGGDGFTGQRSAVWWMWGRSSPVALPTAARMRRGKSEASRECSRTPVVRG